MDKQKGLATLLVITMVLVVSLLFSLASYKNAFYQIKRTQNEVLSRKVHWLAEGGLECGYTEVKLDKILPTAVGFKNYCNSLFSELAINYKPNGAKRFTIYSKGRIGNANRTIKKDIEYRGGLNSTIKVNASVLELTGSQHFVPNPTDFKDEESGGYKCQSVFTSGVVKYISSLTGTDEHFLTTDNTDKAHAGGPLKQVSFVCDSAYKSNLFDSKNRPKYLAEDKAPIKGADIQENQSINVFKDIFGSELSDWKDIRKSFAKSKKGDVIGLDVVNGKGGDNVTTKGWIKDCSKLIKESFEAGNEKIWVDGSCAIGNNAFGPRIDTSSMMLVIFDGFLELNNIAAFNGIIYQYVSSGLNAEEAWKDRIANVPDPVRPFNESDINPAFLNVSLYAFGATYIDGAIGIDAPSRTVRIRGSIIPSYNGGKVDEQISSSVSWVKGSWHDF